ncbi:MAG TPA: CvpA family protein [Candidatus Saccharimonadales bacterium]|nr:CvpA family protein [Candidatus Saccharimonadales bacterium]
MNALDWIIVVLIFLSVLLAAAQGFFFEVFSLSGAVAGFLMAAWWYQAAATWYLPYVKSPALSDLAGFLTIFFVVVLLGGTLARLARWAVKEMGLRWADRVLGGAFGLLRGVIIGTVAIMALTAFAPELPELANSELARYFQVAGRGVSWLAPSVMRQRFHDGMNKLRPAPMIERAAPKQPAAK